MVDYGQNSYICRRKLLFQNVLCYKEDIINRNVYVVIYVKLSVSVKM